MKKAIESEQLMSGCPLTVTGYHQVSHWIPVPAQTLLAGGETRALAPSHERAFCWACDERFYRDGTA